MTVCLVLVVVAGGAWLGKWGWDAYQTRCGQGVDELGAEQSVDELGFDLRSPEDADLEDDLSELPADLRKREIQSRTRLLAQVEHLPAPFGDLVGVDFSSQLDDMAATTVEQATGKMLVSVASRAAVVRPSLTGGGNLWARTYGLEGASVLAEDEATLVQTWTSWRSPRLVSVDPETGEILTCLDDVIAESAAVAGQDVVTANGRSPAYTSEPQVARSDPRSGEVRWKRRPEHLSDLGEPGVRVMDDLALVSSFDLSAYGGLHALDQSSRRLGDPARDEPGERAAPPKEGAVVAYSLDKGEEAWRYPADPHSRDAASVIGTNEKSGVTVMLVLTCRCDNPKSDSSDNAVLRSQLVAVDSASGEVRWKRPGPRDTGGDWHHSAVWGDKIVFDAGDERLQAFDLEDGQRAWTTGLGTAGVSAVSPPIDGKRLVVTDDQLLSVDPETGKARRTDFPQGTSDMRYFLDQTRGSGISVFGEHIVLDYQGAMLVFERSD